MIHRFPSPNLVALFLMMLPTALLSAAQPPDHRDRYEARVYTDGAGARLPYRLLRPPAYDPQTKYPLVLFLHGAGERGDDNRAQLIHGANDFAGDENRQRYPCFVVAPQCPNGQQWVEVPWSGAAHAMPEKPSEPLRLTLELLDRLEREFSIDVRRIYVTGLSMGGFGVWDILARQPTRFAAAVPVCGGGDLATAKRLAAVPIWAFHGAQDGAVKPSRSRDMIAALRQAGGSPRYTEYPDAGHDSWTATYRDPEMMAWLFAQRRPEPSPP
jgi:predicted peptidase